jgi:methionyl-tRNA formyltransferase
VRIAFAGTPDAAVPTLQALINSPHEIAFVITRPDAPKGRGQELTPSPVAQLAATNGLPIIKTSDLSQVVNQVADLDVVVVVAFGGLVPKNLLDVPKFGWINVHFSLLPHWRGAAPVQHAIMAGDDVTGITTFRIEEALDSGPVLAYITTSIGNNETAGQLLDRLSIEGAQLALATLQGLANNSIHPLAQPLDGVSYAPKITTAVARINWQEPALVIARKIRAMTPSPGAWTMSGQDRFKLAPVKLVPDVTHLTAGQLAFVDGQVYVGTGSHAVQLDQIQLPGKTFTAANNWARNLKSDLVFE